MKTSQEIEQVASGRGARTPTSPWMPFSMLFAAISTKVLPQDMDLINTHYEEFKVSFPAMCPFSHHKASAFEQHIIIIIFYVVIREER